MNIKTAFFLPCLVCMMILISFPLQASKIHPILEERIIAGQEDYQQIIIRLKDRMNKESLNSSLSLSSYTRQAAHTLAVNALKEKAQITQKNLIEFLELEQYRGNVRFFKSYWIDNLVWVEIKGELVEQIAQFPEVETIFPDIAVTTITPEINPSPISLGTHEAGDNLRVIGADSMWKMGYTGEGTLVCTFDTGIEGDHPALENSYRGKHGYSHEQCWFDPIDNDTFPHIFSTSQISPGYRPHGTGTISLIVGKDDSTGDTVGVAFGAQWISAGVVDVRDALGRTNIHLLDAFQWAADPDGDPNTVEDVPDVISNSWGYPTNYLGCSDVFYGVIDNMEALGTILIFAAGNTGSAYRTLVNPANRATSPYNSFAVGMISNNYETPVVDAISSRGPSNCNPTIIKPNVVAPGRLVSIAYPLEMNPSSPYGTGTGTSFSCPHAAGAALLLRQYNPNAPVDSVKKALMVGAIDLNETGPDSAAGYGLIYIPTALEYLGPNDEPNIFLSSATYPFIEQGDTVEIGVTLKNSGPGILDVEAKLRCERDDVIMLDTLSEFGDMALDETADNSSNPYRVVIGEEILDGVQITFELYVTGSGSYEVTIPLYILAGNKPEWQFYTHDTGPVQFSISNFGMYGLEESSVINFGGSGFTYEGSSGVLYEMSLLVANDSDHVSDAARNMFAYVNKDFEVMPGGQIQIPETPLNIVQQTISKFNDQNADNPLGLEITQTTLAYEEQNKDHFVLLIYHIKNGSDTPVNGLIVSLFADWDFYNPGIQEWTGFDREAGVGYMWLHNGDDYRGIAVLNDEGVSSYRSIVYDTIYDGFSKSEKWRFASEGFIDTAATYVSDYSHLISTGPFDLDPGMSDTAAFAVIAADSENDLLYLYRNLAQQVYDSSLITDTTPPSFTISPLLNPVLPFEMDIYVYSSEKLISNPSLEVDFPTGPDTIFSPTELDDRDAITYFKDLTISQSGSYSLEACGTDQAGLQGCGQKNFTATLLKRGAPAMASSYSNLFNISIPHGAVEREGILICLEEVLDNTADEQANLIGEIDLLYKLEAKSSSSLHSPEATLSVDLEKLDIPSDETGSLAIVYHKGGQVTILPTELDKSNNRLSAPIDDFGTYILGILKSGGETDQAGAIPNDYELHQNAPNPFNAETMIAFGLPEPSQVRLEVYNILGQKIVTLLDDNLGAGVHRVHWNGRSSVGDDVSTGIYFYRLITDSYKQTKRMLLLK